MDPYTKYVTNRDPLTVAAATPAKIGTLIRGLAPPATGHTPMA